MLYIAENIKSLRKAKGLTQEDVAEMLGVSPQSVSKWERGETYPDVTLLPSLANLFKTSVDAIIGMDKINDEQAKASVFTEAQKLLREYDYNGASAMYADALKSFPNDESFMSELAMALALGGDPAGLERAVHLCERALAGSPSEKVRHTTRAAMCFILLKSGDMDKAVLAAQNLPHTRESREAVLAQFYKKPGIGEIDAYLRFIAIGEDNEQSVISVDIGHGMLSVVTDYNLPERIGALRGEAGESNAGRRILPVVQVRDLPDMPSDRVRVRQFADYLLDKSYRDPSEAVEDIMAALQGIVEINKNLYMPPDRDGSA